MYAEKVQMILLNILVLKEITDQKEHPNLLNALLVLIAQK